MASYEVAFIGTGTDLEDPGPTGFAMNYYHAEGYEKLDNCDLVGCADIIPERAVQFAETFDIPEENVFEDYQELLREVEPDVVSISVWPDIHAELVVECARSDGVEAIHCEKPMDLTWDGSKRMAAVCEDEDVQLTFNHMRRFKPSWVEARELVDADTIGSIERIELSPQNIYDTGTHSIDFAGDLAGDRPAEWVIGQIDYREEDLYFGAHNENQAQAMWEYDNGIKGLISTGKGSSLVPALMRVVGSEGVLEIDPDGDSLVRWCRDDSAGWESKTIKEGRWTDPINHAVAHLIECLDNGTEPSIGAQNALNGTEIIFAIWESARRRERIDLPLEIDGNPLHDMVDAGQLELSPSERSDE